MHQVPGIENPDMVLQLEGFLPSRERREYEAITCSLSCR